jgi:hypothetical protein
MKTSQMKKYSQLQKIISVLMFFILMIELTGCYSTRIISTSEFTVSDKYLIHIKNSTYSVDNVLISDGILSCKLDLSEKNYGNANKTHIYLSSDSVLKINNDLISVPVGSITKIEQKVPDPRKTRTLTTVLIVAGSVGVIAGLSVLLINSLVNSLTPSVEPTMDYCTSIELCGDAQP